MILSGSDLIPAIKSEQAARARALTAKLGRKPRLVIIRDSADPVIMKYVTYKMKYGETIGVEVTDLLLGQSSLPDAIASNNSDPTVDGMIVQLPVQPVALPSSQTLDDVLDQISPAKDVDGLGTHAGYPSATASAIDRLLAGYQIDLSAKKIALVGVGRLVGAPLLALWQARGLKPEIFRRHPHRDLSELRDFDLIVTATGQPGLITTDMVSPGAVIIDAGTATAGGTLAGDVAPGLYQRDDITISAKTGGVGPLTIATLFDHLLDTAAKIC
jgi:methylenetetrahydrofolate dehydrogenase (NADP+)/methenyltetrahydrofolate cyclohydrolase